MSAKTNEEENFPFTSRYDDLITGKTLTKRGLWWTAVLLVREKPKDEEFDENHKKKKKLKTKIIIQRWQKIKRKKSEDSDEVQEIWIRKKDFTISNVSHWHELKNTLDTWITEGLWN